MDSLLVTCNPIFRIITICIPRRRHRDWSEPVSKEVIPAEIVVPQVVPSSSTTFRVQPNMNIEDPLVSNYGRLHFRLDYDFVSNKVCFRPRLN